MILRANLRPWSKRRRRLWRQTAPFNTEASTLGVPGRAFTWVLPWLVHRFMHHAHVAADEANVSLWNHGQFTRREYPGRLSIWPRFWLVGSGKNVVFEQPLVRARPRCNRPCLRDEAGVVIARSVANWKSQSSE